MSNTECISAELDRKENKTFNISKLRREKMIKFLDSLKEKKEIDEDEKFIAINEIKNYLFCGG